jgi:regulator of RNase E activity RraA
MCPYPVGVVQSPGDLIIGDNDGVVVVPKEKIEEIIRIVKEIKAKEEVRMKEIEKGNLIPVWLEKTIKEKLGGS